MLETSSELQRQKQHSTSLMQQYRECRIIYLSLRIQNKKNMQTTHTVFSQRKASVDCQTHTLTLPPTQHSQKTHLDNNSYQLSSLFHWKDPKGEKTTRSQEEGSEMTATQIYFRRFDLFSKTYQISLSLFLQSLPQSAHLICLYRLSKTYRDLIKKHGIFVLGSDHVKFDRKGNMAIWIHLPLQSSEGQRQAVSSFLELSKGSLTERMYKSAMVGTLDQLVLFFQRMSKRSQIHKKCQKMVLGRTEVKRSTFQHRTSSNNFLANGQPRYPKSSTNSSVYSASFELWDNTQSISRNSNKTISQEKRMNLTAEPQDDTTHIRKKSNTMGFINKENIVKDASTSTYDKSQDGILREVSSNHYIESRHECRRSSLEASFKKLFLSQISQDPQSDMYDSRNNMDQFVRDFKNVFF